VYSAGCGRKSKGFGLCQKCRGIPLVAKMHSSSKRENESRKPGTKPLA